MNLRRWLITGLVCVAIFVVLATVKYSQIQAAIAFGKSYPESSATVNALTVTEVDTEFYVNTIGEVVAPQFVELRNELGGRISKVSLPSGGEVKKGDLLLQMDIAQELAQLKAATATAHLARLNLRREEDLIKKNLTSQEKVDAARAQLDVADAAVAELQALIEKKTLTAPFDAFVSIHTLEVGQYLNPNTELTQLMGKNSYVWVDFDLPIAQAQVAIDAEVSIVVPYTGETLEGKVVAADVALSSESRNRHYRARLPQVPALIPNTVVDVSVSLGVQSKVQVPKSALLKDQMGDYVFRLTADEAAKGYRAKRQPVTLGRETNDAAVVEDGLAKGSFIASEGAFKLSDGLLIFVANDKSLNASSSAMTGVSE